MTAGSSNTARNAAVGIARLEDYLLHQAHIRNARVEAQEFADRMPWLTISQHEEVVRKYTENCIAIFREHAASTAALRQRLLCLWLGSVLGIIALSLSAYSFTAYV